MVERLSREQWAMDLAFLTARRSTCLRRAVGCVLLNQRGHVLATGYNGVASGQPHCNHVVQEPIHGPPHKKKWNGEVNTYQSCIGFTPTYPHACPGAQAPSGTNLDGCHAVHAEQNALLQCRDPYAIEAAYVTASPCVTCTKLFLNTSCRTIYFGSVYPQPEAEKLWTSVAGNRWIGLGSSN